ncbi:MAG TPA: hypothetical protein VFI25_03135 [Planctomycetota bacterium]|jgi:hypothetical protein|nr:hypothetical protein [Planctomycetota bacterium]
MRILPPALAGLGLFASGCGRSPQPSGLLAFVPEEALLFATIGSRESLEREVERFRERVAPFAHGPGASTLDGIFGGGPELGPIDASAPAGLVLLEEGDSLVLVRLLPLRSKGASREGPTSSASGEAFAVHGNVAVVSSSGEAVRRCAPREGRGTRLQPTLEGDLVVACDVGRLVDRHRLRIDAALRKQERLFVELPQTISYGPRVPPPPNARLAEGLFRLLRHAVFGVEGAELALDLADRRVRLEAAVQVREGSRAAAALGRIPSAPPRIDLLPEEGDMILQMSIGDLPMASAFLPFQEWMLDGLAEPARGEFLRSYEEVSSIQQEAVGSVTFGPDGFSMTSVSSVGDPERALRATLGYWERLASLRDFFRSSEEVPIRMLYEEPRAWEHEGRRVHECRYEILLQEGNTVPEGLFAAIGGKEVVICAATEGGHLVITVGADAQGRIRLAIDRLRSGARLEPSASLRDWLGRVPAETSFLLALDLGAALRFGRRVAQTPLPFEIPEGPVRLFSYAVARGRVARAGLEFDLGPLLESLRPR